MLSSTLTIHLVTTAFRFGSYSNNIIACEAGQITALMIATPLAAFVWCSSVITFSRSLSRSVKAATEAMSRLDPPEQHPTQALPTPPGLLAFPFTSALNPTKRTRLQAQFNEAASGAMVLIASYLVSGVGLNLQKACWYVHLLDLAPSREAQAQAAGRTYRLGQGHDVRVIEYFVTGSFNERTEAVAVPSPDG